MDTEPVPLLADIINPRANQNVTIRVRCHDCNTVNHVPMWAVAKLVHDTGAHHFHCFSCGAWQYGLALSALDRRDVDKIL